MPAQGFRHPLALRRRNHDEALPPKARWAALFEERVLGQDDRWILCATCGHQITGDGQRIPVRGTHEHDCINPQGHRFHIGCFRDASGCATLGEPTTRFTWFPGFAWSHALCNGCAQHLGWRFESPDSGAFFGLVLDKLITRTHEGG